MNPSSLDQLVNFRPGDPIALCLEVNPPRGTDTSAIMDRLNGSLSKVDFLNVTDSALARMKCSSLPFASLLKAKFGVEPLVNLSCRDRNSIALQADLLSGWLGGVRSVVALTGDAVSIGDSPAAKGVFEVNSIGLLGLMDALNRGVDAVGNSLKGGTSFVPGSVSNPNAKNPGAEVRRLVKKREAGARYSLTQPVFDIEVARSFLQLAQQETQMPILLGLMPIKSGAAGLAMASVPGIRLPDALVRRCEADPHADLSEYSIDLAMEIASACLPYVAGFHVVSGGAPKLGLRLIRSLADVFKS
jgi:5,10-methylenetetrahydrofolate reductase